MPDARAVSDQSSWCEGYLQTHSFLRFLRQSGQQSFTPGVQLCRSKFTRYGKLFHLLDPLTAFRRKQLNLLCVFRQLDQPFEAQANLAKQFCGPFVVE